MSWRLVFTPVSSLLAQNHRWLVRNHVESDMMRFLKHSEFSPRHLFFQRLFVGPDLTATFAFLRHETDGFEFIFKYLELFADSRFSGTKVRSGGFEGTLFQLL